MKNIQTRDEWNSAIQDEAAVIMFSAGWCPDCRVIEPELPAIEKEYSSFTFYHADRDELIEICQEQGVMGIPSFLTFSKGKELHRFVSRDRKTPEEIKQFLDESLKEKA
ncbi:thioredoxin family protein [Sinobaca sp. H24]|uniref:thioredoxin family protein n=1 Tax=Sinobaca sp. H24 TaxID=2923376 RepID=UPI0020794F30|nr:thioredoxin family protein [Sinobaca sp. H24]